MKKSYKIGMLLLIMTLILACGNNANSSSETTDPDPADFEFFEPQNPLDKGQRLFGITISESEKGFFESFLVVQQAGAQMTEFNIPWDMIETGEGEYEDPWGVFGASAFYGENNIKLGLSLGVIDTVRRGSPEYLNHLPYDDPQMVQAFNEMVDWVLESIPENVEVHSIAIGNEIDFVLDESTWPQYISFYRQTAEHIHRHYPVIKIGVKCTLMNTVLNPALLDELKEINQYSDVIMFNYYPQDENFRVMKPAVIHEHFDLITETFLNREIWMTETGYQSGSEHCGSSEAKQAEFFHEMFAAWDEHADQITFVLVNWLHDQSPQQIKEWKKYYGSSNPAFVEYLSTLGLRTHDHHDKLAWQQILLECKARGWVE